MTHSRYLIVVAGGCFALLLAGCSSEFTYVPVRGKVTLKSGKPLTSGTVMLFPDGDNKLRKSPSAKVGADGAYELDTEGRSGVPIGSYIVVVKWPMRKVNGVEPGPPPFSTKYMYPEETPLKMEVVANPTAGAYDLVLDEK
jgi:hypothetical protein